MEKGGVEPEEGEEEEGDQERTLSMARKSET